MPPKDKYASPAVARKSPPHGFKRQKAKHATIVNVDRRGKPRHPDDIALDRKIGSICRAAELRAQPATVFHPTGGAVRLLAHAKAMPFRIRNVDAALSAEKAGTIAHGGRTVRYRPAARGVGAPDCKRPCRPRLGETARKQQPISGRGPVVRNVVQQ
jgi:hypothetical protein